MQTILGASGPIGTELAKALRHFTQEVRLVSRNPKAVHPDEQCLPADLMEPDAVMKAVAGSEVCYLTVGLDYDTQKWRAQWPQIIKNVVAACSHHGSKLVFFDNIYALSKDHLYDITESTPIDPCSDKGKVRAMVDRYVMDAVEKGRINAIIARSPDFFGAFRKNSFLITAVYENLEKGKKAQWFCNAHKKHSFGYTPDLAKGTAILGNAADCYNQVWNLPVDDEALTGTEWVEIFANEMHQKKDVQVLPGFGMKVLGLFIPIMREMYEMRYQFDRDYHFNSSKFKKAFSFTAATNKEAALQTTQLLQAPNAGAAS